MSFALAATTQTADAPWPAVSWAALGIAGACAGAILWDIARGYRLRMGVMNWVYPITALYWGPVALWLYWRRGRTTSPRYVEEHGGEHGADESRAGGEPRFFVGFARRNWWPVTKGTAHCGAGCTLGDICGEWLVFVTAWSIGVFAAADANTLMAMFVADFAFAWTFGIVFQYFSIVPMRDDLGRAAGAWAAIKADTLSIVAFQIGLFGFMALFHLVFWQPPLAVDTPTYWFMMQVGMIIGFFTSWPMNVWLIRRGLKEKM